LAASTGSCWNIAPDQPLTFGFRNASLAVGQGAAKATWQSIAMIVPATLTLAELNVSECGEAGIAGEYGDATLLTFA